MAIDRTKLLPPGQPGTPEGTVVNPGVPAGYVSEKQYNGLNKNILAIRSNLKAIADLLVRRDTQEASEDISDEKRLRKERQESRVQDVESNLGTKIKASLIKPLESMKKKVQGPFGQIMKALKALFFGFVGMKGIDALTAWAEGDTESLAQLKNDLIQALAVGAGVFVALNGGIGLILGAAGSLAGTILGALPAIFGLIVNPYVFLGAAIALGGLALSDYLSDILGGSINSFNPSSQQVMRRLATVGPDKTIEELQRQHDAHLKKYGEFNDFRGERQQMRQEIERIKEAKQGTGPYAHLLGSNISDADKKVFNDILAAMAKIKNYRNLHDTYQTAYEATTDEDEKKKYKAKMDDLVKKMAASQDYIKSLRSSKLSEEGRKSFDFMIEGDDRFFKKRDPVTGLLMDFGKEGLGLGNFDTPEMTDINRVMDNIQTLKDAPDNLLGPRPSAVKLRAEAENNQNLQYSLDDTKTQLKTFNMNKANTVNTADLYDDQTLVNIIPYQLEDESQPMTTMDPTTTIQDMNIPNIFTSDNLNIYRDFADAMYN